MERPASVPAGKMLFNLRSTTVTGSFQCDRVCRCACLQVFEDVHADPVVVRVGDETQAHVGGGVVQVAQQVHRRAAALRSQ